MNSSGHLCSDCGIRLSAQMSVLTVLADVALELVAEAVSALQNSDLASHPKVVSRRWWKFEDGVISG